MEGESNFEFSITPASVPVVSAQESADLASSTSDAVLASTRFDIFVAQGEDACLFDHVDAEAISEPACLSQVIAVGLRTGSYGNCMVTALLSPRLSLLVAVRLALALRK